MSTDYLALCHGFFGLPFSLLCIVFSESCLGQGSLLKLMNRTEICSRFSDLLEEI